ncbi:3-hydroxyacyl-CoA dehydrogenase NAD-binding domain-containing protein, partial [Escherichia coli]|nr:3-hydroxyacyl-CoA dehydrogenase NAD-binding domain-containing protein [Escherichia coli]
MGVVGAGTMGNGIAQVAARAGYRVVMRDVKEEYLQRGLATI